jgi:hypothetical protein
MVVSLETDSLSNSHSINAAAEPTTNYSVNAENFVRIVDWATPGECVLFLTSLRLFQPEPICASTGNSRVGGNGCLQVGFQKLKLLGNIPINNRMAGAYRG